MAFTPITITADLTTADGNPANGTLSATLVTVITNDGQTNAITKIAGLFVNGALETLAGAPFVLDANDDTDTLPNDSYYQFAIDLTGTPTYQFNAVVPSASEDATVDISVLIDTPAFPMASPFVAKIIAGTGVTIEPPSGEDTVTINATGGGGAVSSVETLVGDVVFTSPDSSVTIGTDPDSNAVTLEAAGGGGSVNFATAIVQVAAQALAQGLLTLLQGVTFAALDGQSPDAQAVITALTVPTYAYDVAAPVANVGGTQIINLSEAATDGIELFATLIVSDVDGTNWMQVQTSSTANAGDPGLILDWTGASPTVSAGTDLVWDAANSQVESTNGGSYSILLTISANLP